MRTTSSLVIGVLGQNYDAGDGSRPPADVTPYMAAANAVTDQVNACAIGRGVILSLVQLELIERWMSAHYYTQMDPLYKSRSTLAASGSFAEQSFKEVAIGFDSSKCLKGILKGSVATVGWAGKTPDERDAEQGEGL